MTTEDHMMRELIEEGERSARRKLRDQFAMAALTGLVASDTSNGKSWKIIAESAYASADAMLAQREKDTP